MAKNSNVKFYYDKKVCTFSGYFCVQATKIYMNEAVLGKCGYMHQFKKHTDNLDVSS